MSIYIIICQCPSVCTHAISSHIYGLIRTLKVPIEFLGQAGPKKTNCKVMRPEMKKKNDSGDTFFDSTTYLNSI